MATGRSLAWFGLQRLSLGTLTPLFPRHGHRTVYRNENKDYDTFRNREEIYFLDRRHLRGFLPDVTSFGMAHIIQLYT